MCKISRRICRRFLSCELERKKKDRDWADFRDGVNHDKITGHTEHTQVDDGLMRDER